MPSPPPDDAGERVGALVVLHPAGGVLRGDEVITADDHARFLPDPDALDEAMRWFESVGFTVSAPGPNSFSIDADADVFGRWFDTSTPPFPLDRLPARLRRTVAAVEVSGPPDFGPGNP